MSHNGAQPFLTTDQAAHYVRLSRRTLEKMRVIGDGPLYRKHGRYVRYHIDDLNAWSKARVQRSTTDDGAQLTLQFPGPRDAHR
jgi:excisionase family DNA binding protein